MNIKGRKPQANDGGRMKIKPHQKIKITLRRIKSMGACPMAVEDLKPHLPIAISTNPESNIQVARKAIDHSYAWRTWWLFGRTDQVRCEEAAALSIGIGDLERDLTTFPQLLAMTADALLTEAKWRAA